MQWPLTMVEIGDTSMNDPEPQDIDSDSQENYQEEHVEFYPPVTSNT